jgi:hypothetical protein
MIEKFNFYDLYAYFSPGVVLLTLIVGPFALAVPFSLSVQSGVIALVISYVFGHIVQNIARVLFPSKFRKGSKNRLPSQILLDKDDKSLSHELKVLLTKLIKKEFGLTVIAAEGEDNTNRDEIRDDAFRLCRTYLLQESKKSYAEQLQGMYALFRGISTACLLGIPFYVFVAVGVALTSRIWLIPVSACIWLFLSIGIQWWFRSVEGASTNGFWKRTWKRFREQWYFWFLAAVILVLGSFFDVRALECSHHVPGSAMMFGTIAMVLILVSTALVFATSSGSMMWQFAMTVYREYAALKQKV